MDLSRLLVFNQLVIDKTEDERKELVQIMNIDYDEYKKIKNLKKPFYVPQILKNFKIVA